METWAMALRALSNADINTDLSLVLNVIQGNNTIPVIVMDADRHVTDYRNIQMDTETADDSAEYVARYAQSMIKHGHCIKIFLKRIQSCLNF